MLIRAHRGRLRAILAIVTLATLLAVPFQAFGAKGGDLKAEVDPLVEVVTPGQVVAFSAYFKNTSGTPMPHFGFSGSAPGVSLVAFYPPGEPCEGVATSTLTCTFGTLAVNDDKLLTLAFRVPTDYEASSVRFTGTFSADSSSKGKPTGSQRQDWSNEVSVSVVAGNDDFYATWQPPNEPGTFGPFGSTQQTTVHGPTKSSGYVVELSQTGETFGCTGSGWGKTVELDVAGGDEPIAVEIIFAREPGLTPQQLRIMYVDDADNCVEVPVKAICNDDEAPCHRPSWFGSGPTRQVQTIVHLEHNGRLKGF